MKKTNKSTGSTNNIARNELCAEEPKQNNDGYIIRLFIPRVFD